jgi:hypothetical protein
MRPPDRSKVRLALLIIIEQAPTSSFGWEEWDMLGFDPYKFSFFGSPSKGALKEKAVEILLDAILWMGDDNCPKSRDDQSY